MSVFAAEDAVVAGELATVVVVVVAAAADAAGDVFWAEAAETIPRVTKRVEAISFIIFLCIELIGSPEIRRNFQTPFAFERAAKRSLRMCIYGWAPRLGSDSNRRQ